MSEKRHGIEDLIGFAMDAIHLVGEKAINYYGKGRHQIKFDERLVTEAELHLTDLFQNQLQACFPDHQMFKDNYESQNYSHKGQRYLWIFDPLDGVANFQAGIPIWGISMALIENFWPVFGVFYMPVTGDLFYAQAGQKAYWGNEEIRISPIDTLNDESLLLTYSRFHLHYNSLFPGKIRALGCTAAHICYVAMGRADAAVIANESFQDLAAARVIIESAGGRICKFDGSDFHLNDHLDGQKIESHLIVSAPDIISQIQNCIRSIA